MYKRQQLPADPKSGDIVGTTIKEQTQQAIANLENVLAEMNLELRHVVKTTVFMSDLNEFNEFNEAYAEAFTAPYPARSCVQVAALPKGCLLYTSTIKMNTHIM